MVSPRKPPRKDEHESSAAKMLQALNHFFSKAFKKTAIFTRWNPQHGPSRQCLQREGAAATWSGQTARRRVALPVCIFHPSDPPLSRQAPLAQHGGPALPSQACGARATHTHTVQRYCTHGKAQDRRLATNDAARQAHRGRIWSCLDRGQEHGARGREAMLLGNTQQPD
jgi:hypothetical protein